MRTGLFLLVLVLFFSLAQANGDSREAYMKHYSVVGKFADVRDDLELAITGRGIKINNVAHIGPMLERTAKDLGATKQVFLNAEAFEFCSATVSRKTMEADPHNIVFCPYVIAVYVLPDDPERVHLAFRRPLLVGSEASKSSLKAVENLLDGIVSEVVQ